MDLFRALYSHPLSNDITSHVRLLPIQKHKAFKILYKLKNVVTTKETFIRQSRVIRI